MGDRPVHARRQPHDEAVGHLESVMVTLALYLRLFEFSPRHSEHSTNVTMVWCGVVCVCTFVRECTSVSAFGSLLQIPSLASHLNITLAISVLSLVHKGFSTYVGAVLKRLGSRHVYKLALN